MKVCIYLELQGLLEERSGIGTAVKQQVKALAGRGVEITQDLGEDYDILHLHTIGPKSFYQAGRAKRKGKKLIIHAHTTKENFENSFRGSNFVSPLLGKYLKRYYSKADLLLTPSTQVKEELRGELDVPVEFITNGVDLEKFKGIERYRDEYREKYGLDGAVAFSVGNVFERKGIDTFVKLGKEFKDMKFAWFGPIYGSLLTPGSTKKMMDNAPGNVQFTGYIDDIRGGYAAGDIFLFPTWNETQSLVILEAAACGKPILTRDIPVFEGWLEHRKNCMKASTHKEFAEYLRELRDDERLGKKLVRNARKLAEEHSLDKMGAKLSKVYASLLAS